MSLSISFSGKRVLITGAARGLGRSLVETLSAQKAIIFALARTESNLIKLKEDFPNITTICVDLRDWEATKKAVGDIGYVDCLINCAGVAYVSSFLSTTPEQLKEMMEVNVYGAMNVSQVIAEGMIKNKKGGSIVHVSSVAAVLGNPNIGAYCMTKSALDMLTKVMAVELGPHNIRVNSVNPTTFYSDMTKDFLANNPNGGANYLNRVPIKRIAETYEIVNTILFMLSDAAPMIHGTSLLIDGGFTAS